MNGFGRGEEHENKDKTSIITRETVGMTLLLFSAVLLFITATGRLLFGAVGFSIAAFFIGLFGYLCYPLFALVMYLSAVMTFGSRHTLPVAWGLRGGFLLLSVFLIVHTATSASFLGDGYGAYLNGCWTAATQSLANGTGGGVLLGLVVYPVCLLSLPAAYVVFSLLLILSVWVFLRGTPLKEKLVLAHTGARRKEEPAPRSGVSFDELPARERHGTVADVPRPAPTPAPAPAEPTASSPSNRDILFGGDPATNYRSNLIFDRDSYFNTRERHSSVEPPRTRPTPSSLGGESYTERYSRAAETQRPGMPRRVTGEPSSSRGGYSYPVHGTDEPDANYPQMPAYRAPTSPVSPARDYYANDVPTPSSPTEEPTRFERPTEDPTRFERPTEGPTRFDRPTEEPSRFERPTEGSTRFERPSEDTARFERPTEGSSRFERPSEDTARFERPTEGPTRFERPTEDTSRFERPTEEPSRFERPSESSSDRESSFRSLFSRSVEEHTQIPEQPPFGGDDEEEPPESRVFGARGSVSGLFDESDGSDGYDEIPEEEPVRPEPLPDPVRRPAERQTPKPHVYRPYERPDMDQLRLYTDKAPISQEEIERNSDTIVETLAAFRQDVEVVKVTCGPAVVRYDIDVPKNIPVGAVTKHAEDIAMRLCAKDGVNMYNNTARGVVSIEVPKPEDKRSIVGLRSVLEAEEYVNAKPNSLMVALGKSLEGRNICGNIVKMTHLLVAGSTGSGKSVFLNAMLVSLVCKYSPEDLRLILIDPKKVEFAIFEDLPHLMINEIITEAPKAVQALSWAIKEMERRYKLFEVKGKATRNAIRDVDGYNAARVEGEEKLPRILIVFDELADFMTVARKDIEERVGRIAAKARAAGIHLVLATQRPSVDVITGVIKNNLPTRIAFRVIAEYDSRTILDESGAEKLLGNGDMLYRPESGVQRLQGAYISDDEVRVILNEIKDRNEAYYDDSVADFINKTNASQGDDDGDGADEAPTQEAIRALGIVVTVGQASISLIQRKCSIGYAHAGKIIEWMERMNYISPFDGTSKARQVILTKEEYESKYGPLN